MFDNLRQQSLQETEQASDLNQPFEHHAPSPYFLGLSPVQRFVLALIVFVASTALGCFALVAMEKVVLPF